MTEREALKLALEALKHMCHHTRAKVGYKGKIVEAAMSAAEEALAQSEQKPVAWLRTSGTGSPVVTEELLIAKPEFRCEFGTPLYLTQRHRPWIELTDWEISSVANNNHPLDGIRTFARAIEAAVWEKQK